MITSELVSILSVGLPALGAVLSALVSFLGIMPGTERKLHRLVNIHRDMPDGEGRDAVEDAVNQLAVQAARRALSGRDGRRAQRPRRRLDGIKVFMMGLTVLVGGGLTWFFWWLGSLAPWPVLQWPLWIVAGAVTLVTTFVVMSGDVFQDEDRRKPAPDAPTPASADQA